MTIAPGTLSQLEKEELITTSWVCIVWNDPINLMNYVTYVFMTYFKYSKET